LLGVALGVAGAAFAVGPWSETEASSGLGVPPAAVSPAAVSPAAVSPAAVSPAVVPPVVVSPAEGVSPRESSTLGRLDMLPEQGLDGVVPEGVGSSEVDAAPAVRGRAAQARSPRDRRARGASEPRRDGPVPKPPGVSAARGVDAPEGTEPRLESASLDAEVRLVDDMRWAARRNDLEALARFVATYHESFPDGQLEEEVSAFAAQLERPTTP